MACLSSSSSSSSSRIWKHDVFVSFRDEDTRDFTRSLLTALEGAGITTFSVNKKLENTGDSMISILREIEESQIHMVVFSENYAASRRCLEEMAKIAGCINVPGHSVMPIFYRVNRSKIVKKRYDAEHEEKFRLSPDEVRRWRVATTALAKRPGWVVRDAIDPVCIDRIVKKAMKKLDRKAAVGIECRAQKLEKLMNLSSINDVRFVGICGMGGIGKTTLAASVYRKISHQFDASCFLADISKYSKMPSAGLSYLQGELLRRTLYERHINMSDMSECSYSSLQHRRMLVVLDDVDELKQLERLAKTREWFGVGSRIIITTRDEHILKVHGVDDIYKVGLLNEDEALQLFCMTAFKCDYPMSGYEEMTYSALEYVSGLPLAIKSLGSSLINLSVSEWRSALPKLQETPDKSIQRVLRKSLDGLGSMEMQMFLDIACFFSGEDINYVKEIFISLHGEVYESIIGVLIDQSLVTISHQRIQMHYMLQKVGQEIVRDESLQKIGKQSRIWLYNDFCRAVETRFLNITRKIRLDNVEAIVLNQKDVEGTPLSARRFTYMNNLRLLILHNVNFSREGWLGLLSYKLQYISWHKYPFPYWPIDYYSPMLVECLMPDSHMTRLWTRKEMFPGLRRLDLRNSKYLLKTADFEGLPNLERIDLEGCTSLLLLHSSIACLPKLTFLNLKNCTSLVSLPNNLFDRSSLQVLNLAGCSQLVECLSFSPLKSSIQVKLLSIQLPSFLSKLLF